MTRIRVYLPLLLVACGPSGAITPGDTATGDDPGVTPPTGDDDPNPTGGPTLPEGPGLYGRIIDPAGQEIAQAHVLACTWDFCLTADTAPDGTFAFQLDPGTLVALKTHEALDADPPLGAALEPALVPDGDILDVGTVYVPALAPPAKIGPTDPQTLAVGDGLELTFHEADLSPPLGVFLHEIAAGRIPAEHVPPYPHLDEEVVAVYAVAPFNTLSASPVGVRLPSDLPAGTLVHVRSIDAIGGALSDPAVAHADGAHVVTDPGEGVFELSHLVVSLP